MTLTLKPYTSYFLLIIIINTCFQIKANENSPFESVYSGIIFTDEQQKKYKQDIITAKIIYIKHLHALLLYHPHRSFMGTYGLYDIAKKEFKTIEGKIPEDLMISKDGGQYKYCYHEEEKKVILAETHWSYQKNKKLPIISWKLNVDTAEWEAISSDQTLGTNAEDFINGKRGSKIPEWSQVIYDPYNKEAILLGGGGTWGNLSDKEIEIQYGQWYFVPDKKAVARHLDKQKTITAKRWFPSHVGTHTLAHNSNEWKPLSQPLEEQPTARIWPSATYDSKRNQILLFGGDNLQQCLNDTWVYDCQNKSWKKLTTTPISAKTACGLVYIPSHDAYYLFGGYEGGWKSSNDIWKFDPNQLKWQLLDLKLPQPSFYSSAIYIEDKDQLYIQITSRSRGNKNIYLYELKSDLLKNAKIAESSENIDPKQCYHSVSWGSVPTPLPGDWPLAEKNIEDRKKELAELPANKWVLQKTPEKSPSKHWGINIYDINSHKGFSWGGGHSHYPGAEINVYSLLENRWDLMNDPVNYNPAYLHGMVAGPPGVSFGGWSLLPSHARKSYGVDPVSGSVVLYSGDVYNIQENQYAGRISDLPMNWGGPSNQVAYVTTPSGLYAMSDDTKTKKSIIAKANVSEFNWDIYYTGEGPGTKHTEYHYLVYDSKRNRLMYFSNTAEVWAFDLSKKTWQKEESQSGKPKKAHADGTYIPELDAVLMICKEEKTDAKEKLLFYQLEEKSWYELEYQGDGEGKINNSNGLAVSPIYDPTHKVIVRFSNRGAKWIEVYLMKLDEKTINWKKLQ